MKKRLDTLHRTILVSNQGTFSLIAILLFFIIINSYMRESIFIANNPDEKSWKSETFEYIRPEVSVSLPKILTNEDKLLYREIFALQKNEKWQSADEKIKQVKNKILMGHVWQQRFLHPYYNPKKPELQNWLAKYSDHPQAHKIYKLGAKIDPTFSAVGIVMKDDYLSGYGDGSGLTRSVEYSLSKRHWGDRDTAYNVWKTAHYHLRNGRVSYAYSKYVLSGQYEPLLKPLEMDMLKQSISETFFAYNKEAEALAVAKSALQRSGEKIQNLYWVAGMSAWRLGKWQEAADYFYELSKAKNISPWKTSAGGLWAYRAYKKIGDGARAFSALSNAHEYPKTFYGMLASAELGQRILLNNNDNISSGRQVRELTKMPGIKRAVALMEIGDRIKAEAELRKIYPTSPLAIKKSLITLANLFDIPGLEIRMASMVATEKSSEYDPSLYPVPRWTPEDGFTLNPALLFAFARHESGFNPYAKSHAGARGLMQLMPNTASYMARKNKYRITTSSLYSPPKNLTVGQDYLEYLLDNKRIDGNLLFLAAAYNAGPNKLNRWVKSLKYNDDPLLFIESIPSTETRNFIKRILSNYWIYRERLGFNTPSMQALLEGSWPLYKQESKEAEKPKIALLWSQ